MKKSVIKIRTMKNNLVVISFMISSIFLFASCEKDQIVNPSKQMVTIHDRNAQQNAAISSVASDVKILPVEPPITPAFAMIKIEHNAVRSEKPDYCVTVYTDGNVVFEGRRNVTFIGTKELKISMDKVELLKTLFERVGFFSIIDDLPVIADAPFNLTTYAVQQSEADAEKTLKDYDNGIPPDLIWLRITTESILDIDWLIRGHD